MAQGSFILIPPRPPPHPQSFSPLQIKRLAPHLPRFPPLPTQAETYQGGVGEGELPVTGGGTSGLGTVRVGWEGGWWKF